MWAEDEAVGGQDWSFAFAEHFAKVDGIRLVVEGCVDVAGGGVEIHRLEWVERRRECDVGYVGTEPDSEIGEASFVVRPIRDERELIHRHRRRRLPFSPFR